MLTFNVVVNVLFWTGFLVGTIGGMIFGQNFRPSRERRGRFIGRALGVLALLSGIANMVAIHSRLSNTLDMFNYAFLIFIPFVFWIMAALITWVVTESNAFGRWGR